MQMRVSNNLVDRVRTGQRSGAFLRFELVAVGGGRGPRELVGRLTFDKIGGNPICGRARWDRCLVRIRRRCHLGATFRPPKTVETNEVAVDGKVSNVADAGCMSHAEK